MRRAEVSPAAIGSVGLHLTVAAALMISWGARDLTMGSVVPVTIVSSAPADLRPAIEGPTEQTALTDEVIEAPPEVTPPAPQPKAAPPKAAPTPTPKPRPVEKSLDLDALADSIARKTQGARPAPKGPTRAETALTARDTTGTGDTGAALAGLVDELQRRWNPNCDVVGGRDVQLRVIFRIGVGGQVVGDARSEIRSARTPVAEAAADRAIRAVYAASPFRNLPREFYGDSVAVNFNAREACAFR